MRQGLLFLTTSCKPCRVLWRGAEPGPPVTIVTPSAETESRRTVERLAPDRVAVEMDSELWHRYGVTKAPWLVVTDDGSVADEGPAPESWEDVVRRVIEARP